MIVDFRARPNTDVYMATCTGPGSEGEWRRFGCPPPPVVDLDSYVDSLRQNGVDRALFTGRQKFADGELVRGFSNDYVAGCVEAHPDILVGFAGADPTAGTHAVREVRRAVEELGLSGLSLDPAHSDSLPDDRILYPLYSVADELGIPVVLTMGPLVGRASDPRSVDRVAEDFPDLTIICSHGCWPKTDQFIALAYRHDNVYLEASIYEFLPGAAAFLEAAGTILQDRVVYGSAFPFQALDSYRRLTDAVDYPPEVLEKILSGNALRILGLDAKETAGATSS